MRIQHNIMAMNAYRNYTNNVSAMKKNLEKLSSGYKINRAGDDAAGLAISEKMRAQITGLETAQKNAKDGISLVQTAEGALTEVHDMLNRMVTLATQSANGTYDNETDRVQLQKELDQLRTEIDRIADSSNFNGIKLLNGTLGLNEAAFSDITTAAATEATDGSIDLSSLLAPSTASKPDLHLETASASGVDPQGVIDLGNLSLKVAGKGTATKAVATLTFNIGGSDISVKFSNTNAAAQTVSTAAIAGSLKTELLKSGLGVDKTTGAPHATATSNNAIKLGNGIYSITGTNQMTLNFEGYLDESGTFVAKSATAGDFSDAIAKQLNEGLGKPTTLKSATGQGTVSGDIVHTTTTVNHATAKVDAGMAGIDLKLTADMIQEGNTLTIDGQTFTFKTKDDSTLTGTGVIDVSTAKTDEERIHMAVDALSKQTVTGQDSRTWKIGSKNADTIHIEQSAATATGKPKLNTYEALTSKITAKGQAQSAKNASTSIKIDDSSVLEGNALNIDGKKYIFSDKNTGTAADGSTYVAIKGGAGANLAAAIGSTASYDSDTNTLTVYAANADDASPSILGKGLTLQIGDTAEDFNQLNVTVKDTHCTSLGIDGANLSISDQDSAAAAIDKLKAAINYVSDVRGTLGATQNRLDHTINNLSVMQENIQDAESTIRDTDVAEEMMAYTKNNILIQSAQAMLAQANQVPQGVLQLLQ